MKQYKNIKYSDDFKICKGLANKKQKIVEFHPNMEKISDYAFTGEQSIEEIYLNQDVHGTDEIFFSCDNIKKAVVNTKTVPEGFLNSCAVGYVYPSEGVEIILENVETIRKYAFIHSKIKSISFPDTLTKIEYDAFACTKFQEKELHLPNGLKYIGENAFSGSNLTDVYIPNSVIFFGEISNCKCDIIFHMTQETFDRLRPKGCKIEIIKELDDLIDKYTFKQLNTMNLERENNINRN